MGLTEEFPHRQRLAVADEVGLPGAGGVGVESFGGEEVGLGGIVDIEVSDPPITKVVHVARDRDRDPDAEPTAQTKAHG